MELVLKLYKHVHILQAGLLGKQVNDAVIKVGKQVNEVSIHTVD